MRQGGYEPVPIALGVNIPDTARRARTTLARLNLHGRPLFDHCAVTRRLLPIGKSWVPGGE